MADMKSMGLYRNVDRILADLAASGLGPDDPLTVDDLTPYDQYHYEGTTAVDDAIDVLEPSSTTTILDVGSGLGGPARYIADRTASRVCALELQPDLHETAVLLTHRCGLESLVDHVCGDVLATVTPSAAFDGIVSMLCFLHIADRSTLLRECARSLRPGGAIFVDDYYARQQLTPLELEALEVDVRCPYLPDLDTYVQQLETAGFVNVRTVDKTADWAAFVSSRLESFRAATPDLLERYGNDTVSFLDRFYATVAGLFAGGNLGGIRITARLG